MEEIAKQDSTISSGDNSSVRSDKEDKILVVTTKKVRALVRAAESTRSQIVFFNSYKF